MPPFLMAALLSAALAQDTPPPAAAERPVLPQGFDVVDAEAQDEALRALEERAEAGDPASAGEEALVRAQFAFATGNYDSALIYSETAAAAGLPRGATLAGLIHMNGLVANSDDSTAVRYFRRADTLDEPVAMFHLGQMARASRGGLVPSAAAGYFARSARAGHVPAMLAHALILKTSPVPQDAAEALEWAERAAVQNNIEAMYEFARLLDDWEGGPHDLVRARDWYRRAADAGHAEAALQAGLMAAEGAGGDEDPVEALTYVRQSAEAGFAAAQGQYGLMLHQGWNGTEPDAEAAADWFRQGAEGGDGESAYLYALALATGDGVETSLPEAYFWTLRARRHMDGSVNEDVDRERLQAGLENILPVGLRREIEARLEIGG
ncbi:MAG: hypothetical protein CMF74_17050 [Maricaulis sp.]|jgi:TPR repeat protein|nr:hypothetical protein [Maricaulis sp.]HAQ35237.1 hypothetical protein [Alphaproteobacteria bacterium]